VVRFAELLTGSNLLHVHCSNQQLEVMSQYLFITNNCSILQKLSNLCHLTLTYDVSNVRSNTFAVGLAKIMSAKIRVLGNFDHWARMR